MKFNAILCFLPLVLGAVQPVWSQTQPTGLVFDDTAYEKLPRQSLYGDGGKSEEKALQGVLKADLKPFCPRPKHQGRIGSCVGWASGYAALTIQHAIQKHLSGKTEEITTSAFSALYIYNQIKLGACSSGAYIGDAFQFLKDHGDILSSQLDRDINNCDTLPPLSLRESAKAYKIKDYLTLFGPNDEDQVKINKTKLSLAQNKPVVIAMILKENFASLKSGDEYWFPEVGNTNPLGGHAMCVVGFDEGREAFEIMNSWGEYWGNGGFIWVKYMDFVKYCRYAFQFSLSEQAEKIDNERTGSFVLRYPSLVSGTAARFETLKPTYTKGVYGFSRKKGDICQLQAKGLSEGSYLYIFSLDPQGELKVHWPRDGKLDGKFEGLSESALITVPDVEITIPSASSGLIFNKTGKDKLCILIAEKPIEDLNTQLARLKAFKSGGVLDNLYKIFGSRLLPQNQITFSPDNMRYSTKMAKNKIIPLVAEVNVGE